MKFPTAKQIINNYTRQKGTIVEFLQPGDQQENVGRDYYVMWKCSQGKAPVPVDVELAQGLVNLCSAKDFRSLEEEMRSLSMFDDDRLLFRECKKCLGDLCLVILPRHPGASAKCTCELFCKCAECPHVVALLELKQQTSLLDRPLQLGVSGRAGGSTAPEPASATSPARGGFQALFRNLIWPHPPPTTYNPPPSTHHSLQQAKLSRTTKWRHGRRSLRPVTIRGVG